MTSPGNHGVPSRRQKRMGPAPFASFEDLSDEVRAQVDSPEEKIDAGSVVRLPGIREDVTPSTPASLTDRASSPQFVYTGISLIGSSGAMLTPQPTKTSLQTPNTPRIDISRASSSSQHEDSRDSTPERELFEGHDPARVKLGLGFREEGALDLRSSTEELDFQDGKQKIKPIEETIPNHQRKDSQSSEICMLSISGRTSRLSSIGSQGSTHSRVSNASHLSVVSGQSGLSRSPSPHKMLLETSFCGVKPNEEDKNEKTGTKMEVDLEKVILSRKHDPTKAILAEGISVSPKIKPISKDKKEKPSITITIDKSELKNNLENKAKLPKTIVAPSGIEYTYIPLKGPLPEDPPDVENKNKSVSNVRKRVNEKQGKKIQEKPSTSHQSSLMNEPKFIRIKLKPDHLYDEDLSMEKPDLNFSLDLNDKNTPICKKLDKFDVKLDEKLNEKFNDKLNEKFNEKFNEKLNEKLLNPTEKIIKPESRSISSTPSASPKLTRHILKEPFGSSKSPSPSLSRKSSFASLFKSKETISPESPTIPTRRKSTLSGIIKDASENLRERRRSRSKSRERDKNNLSLAPSNESIDSKSKKNVFSIFKGGKKTEKAKETDYDKELFGSFSNVEFKFRPERCEMPGKYHETPLEGDSIRIPLHSPTYYEQKGFLQDLRSSSQGSQETVIENVIYKDENLDKNEGLNKDENLEEKNKVLDEKNQFFDEKNKSFDEKNKIFDEKNKFFDEKNKFFDEKNKYDQKNKNFDQKNKNVDQKNKNFDQKSSNFDQKDEHNLKTNFEKDKNTQQDEYNYQKDTQSTKKIEELRQNSTSSENLVFSTRLGSTNELFTTKLPKQKIEEVSIETYTFENRENRILEQRINVANVSANIESQKSQKKGFKSHDKEIGEEFKREINQKMDDFHLKDLKQQKEDEFSFKDSSFKEDFSFESLTFKENKKFDLTQQKEKENSLKQDTLFKKSDLIKLETLKLKDLPSDESKKLKKPPKTLNDDEHNSSESERDSEIDFIKEKPSEEKSEPVEIERKGLVMLQDSFEDELPYIPTTLPQERSVAVPIVPIKQRSTFEMKVCPIERPRSTTPINPSCLEDYCEEIESVKSKNLEEKLKISLPREDSIKSPRRPSNTNWADFAEKKIQRRLSQEPESIPPPLPPKGIHKEWINFEEIPEKRKPPKRIQTIPSRGNIEVPESVLHDNVVYSYVNPEDCKCECHEINARARSKEGQKREQLPEPVVQEDELPLLQDEQAEEEKIIHGNVERIKLDVTILDRRSVISDSSIDLSTSVEHHVETNGVDCLRMPFTSDLGVSSNRSSIVSQDENQTPEGSPNAFSKTS